MKNSNSKDANDLRRQIEDKWKDRKETPFCLLIGSGVTRKFVGTWPELLNQLLCARLINRWLDDSNHESNDIQELIRYIEKFDFFKGEGHLEQGDYLLSDDCEPGSLNSLNELVWQEKYFSNQVSLALEKKIQKYSLNPLEKKRDMCEGKKCSTVCAAFNKSIKKPSDFFVTLKEVNENKPFSTREEREDQFKNCPLYHDISTLMAVVEICLSGSIRHIINYNFDTVIEQILADERVLELSGRYTEKEPLHIHIWTYGQSKQTDIEKKKTDVVWKSSRSVLHFHFGEDWIYQETLPSNENHIHFYHVHGIGGIPEDWKTNPSDSSDSSDSLDSLDSLKLLENIPIIFSEHSYTEYQKAEYNWSNRTIVNLMRKFSIMMVGFSGEDANFRSIARSIKNSNLYEILTGYYEDNKEKPGNLILLRSRSEHKEEFEGALNNCYKDSAIVHGTSKDISGQVEFFSDIYEKMVSNYYRNYFNISVYWEDNFDKIAGFLMERI